MKRITKWHKHWNPVSWLITSAWNRRVKGRNRPPDFERDLYDLGQDHRPHSRQVTGARCTGGRGSPVMSWILPKANNGQQTSGVGDKRFFRFTRNAYHLWTAIIRHRLNDIIHQQVERFNQRSKFAIIFKVHLKHPQCHYQGNLLRPWPQKLTVLVGQCWHLDPPFTCADKDLCR